MSRECKRAAHIAAAGILSVGEQAVAFKLRGNLLIVFIFGFLQFPSVGHEGPFAVPVIHKIDFRARHRERNRFRRREKFAHFLPFFIAFSAPSAVAPVATTGIPAPQAPLSAPAVSTIRASGVLPPLARVVAIIRVELPGAKNGCARRRRRIRSIRRNWNGLRRRCRYRPRWSLRRRRLSAQEAKRRKPSQYGRFEKTDGLHIRSLISQDCPLMDSSQERKEFPP